MAAYELLRAFCWLLHELLRAADGCYELLLAATSCYVLLCCCWLLRAATCVKIRLSASASVYDRMPISHPYDHHCAYLSVRRSEASPPLASRDPRTTLANSLASALATRPRRARRTHDGPCGAAPRVHAHALQKERRGVRRDVAHASLGVGLSTRSARGAS
jgi:hypothetical protein